VARALTMYPDAVAKKGALFAKELLTGVSHCID
jgi:hypothetical protein